MEELDIITLAEAGELLGRSPTTLRHQAASGRFRAKLVGKTWVTTRAEVERYRRDSLGKPGRPPSRGRRRRAASQPSSSDSADTRSAVVDAIVEAIDRGAWTTAEVIAALRADPQTREYVVLSGGPSAIGIARDALEALPARSDYHRRVAAPASPSTWPPSTVAGAGATSSSSRRSPCPVVRIPIASPPPDVRRRSPASAPRASRPRRPSAWSSTPNRPSGRGASIGTLANTGKPSGRSSTSGCADVIRRPSAVGASRPRPWRARRP
jgi:hypothetical protein